MKRIMKNEIGQVKVVKEGFSWTMLFFGIFVPLYRGDWKWFLIILIANLFTYGLASVAFAFIYNKIYIDDLLEKELGQREIEQDSFKMTLIFPLEYKTAAENYLASNGKQKLIELCLVEMGVG